MVIARSFKLRLGTGNRVFSLSGAESSAQFTIRWFPFVVGTVQVWWSHQKPTSISRNDNESKHVANVFLVSAGIQVEVHPHAAQP